ncbi:MAG: Shedu anti-phage system protein SduA domain-containing protein [Pleomorphochaeta sp.]
MKKNYSMKKKSPKNISFETYKIQIMEKYNNLLTENIKDESIFQLFFENNPSFLPGALILLGHSGHAPYMNALISQPNLGNAFNRRPDFLWLASDSIKFCPVFIEIENPNKKMFTKNKNFTSQFTQAYGQILEWKSILNKPHNQLSFFDFFNVSDEIRRKKFEPQYLLIYGRRDEYSRDDFFIGKRAEIAKDDLSIVSYDRLYPIDGYSQFVTCKVKDKNYEVIGIPPTYRYMPMFAEELSKYLNFKSAILKMEMTTEERKKFLLERYDYWKVFGKKKKGNGLSLLDTGDSE